jgi:hypothetical protein
MAAFALRNLYLRKVAVIFDESHSGEAAAKAFASP